MLASCAVCRISRWAYRERGLPLRVEGKVDFSPYNPQPSDAQSRLLVTCTGVSEAAEGIKTFHFGIPRTETGQPAAVHYTPGQYASFDIQVRQAKTCCIGKSIAP